jgi:hypothetical protein
VWSVPEFVVSGVRLKLGLLAIFYAATLQLAALQLIAVWSVSRVWSIMFCKHHQSILLAALEYSTVLLWCGSLRLVVQYYYYVTLV